MSRLFATLAGDVDAAVTSIRTARADARASVWSRRRPLAGAPGTRTGGQVIVDIDATLVGAHSEKENLVGRDFTATGPNQLCLTDPTYVPTWAGIAYVCFIIDAYSRAIVGWRVASHMWTTMVLDAIELARWSRGTQLTGLPCHSAAGSQFTSIRYGERLAEIGAVPSIGTVGDSYDCG